jgi:hypothetical protein
VRRRLRGRGVSAACGQSQTGPPFSGAVRAGHLRIPLDKAGPVGVIVGVRERRLAGTALRLHPRALHQLFRARF